MRIWAACAADGECVGQNKGMQSAGVSAAKGDDRVNEGVVNSKQVLKMGGKLLHARIPLPHTSSKQDVCGGNVCKARDATLKGCRFI